MGLLDQIMSGVTSLTGMSGGSNTHANADTSAAANAGPLGGLGGLATAITGGGSKAQLLSALMALIASGKFGGFDGFLNKFNNNGMQNQLASWVSTRPNEGISPAQVEQALGTDTINEIAQKAGMDETQAAQGLSELIPQVVDKMTPTGVMPQQDIISDVVGRIGHKY